MSARKKKLPRSRPRPPTVAPPPPDVPLLGAFCNGSKAYPHSGISFSPEGGNGCPLCELEALVRQDGGADYVHCSGTSEARHLYIRWPAGPDCPLCAAAARASAPGPYSAACSGHPGAVHPPIAYGGKEGHCPACAAMAEAARLRKDLGLERDAARQMESAYTTRYSETDALLRDSVELHARQVLHLTRAEVRAAVRKRYDL